MMAAGLIELERHERDPGQEGTKGALSYATQRLRSNLLIPAPRCLEAHLQGAAREHALRSRGLAHEVGDPDVYVFRMCERSREAKIKAGEFNLSLMPEDRLDLQHRIVAGVKRDNPMLAMMGPVEPWEFRTSVRKGCKIIVLRFDRVDRIVIVRVRALFQSLVQLGIFNLAFDPQQGRFGIIDPLHADYFVGSRLVPALRAIKVPPPVACTSSLSC